MSMLQRCAISIVAGLLFATAALTPARATEPAHDIPVALADFSVGCPVPA